MYRSGSSDPPKSTTHDQSLFIAHKHWCTYETAVEVEEEEEEQTHQMDAQILNMKPNTFFLLPAKMRPKKKPNLTNIECAAMQIGKPFTEQCRIYQQTLAYYTRLYLESELNDT